MFYTFEIRFIILSKSICLNVTKKANHLFQNGHLWFWNTIYRIFNIERMKKRAIRLTDFMIIKIIKKLYIHSVCLLVNHSACFCVLQQEAMLNSFNCMLISTDLLRHHMTRMIMFGIHNVMVSAMLMSTQKPFELVLLMEYFIC